VLLLSELEGLPRSLRESLSLRLPLVGSRIRGGGPSRSPAAPDDKAEPTGSLTDGQGHPVSDLPRAAGDCQQ
jgi:hypothetical protein